MSYHAKHRVTDGDLFDNQLIFGDKGRIKLEGGNKFAEHLPYWA